MTDKEINSIIDELNSVRPEKLNGKARKLFDTIMQILDEKDDLKAELHAEQIKNKKLELETIPLLEGKIKQYEQHLDLEWVEDNFIEMSKYRKLKQNLSKIEKIIEEVFDPIIEHNPSFYLIDAEGLKNRIIEKIKKLEGNEMINKDELIGNQKINYEDLSKEELIRLLKLADATNEALHNTITFLLEEK